MSEVCSIRVGQRGVKQRARCSKRVSPFEPGLRDESGRKTASVGELGCQTVKQDFSFKYWVREIMLLLECAQESRSLHSAEMKKAGLGDLNESSR